MECSEWFERFENNANQPPQILVFVFFGIFVILADIRGRFEFFQTFFSNIFNSKFLTKIRSTRLPKNSKTHKTVKKLAKDIKFIIQNIYTMQKNTKTVHK